MPFPFCEVREFQSNPASVLLTVIGGIVLVRLAINSGLARPGTLPTAFLLPAGHQCRRLRRKGHMVGIFLKDRSFLLCQGVRLDPVDQGRPFQLDIEHGRTRHR